MPYNERMNKRKRRNYIPRIVPGMSTSSKIFVDKKTKAARDRRALNRVEY